MKQDDKAQYIAKPLLPNTNEDNALTAQRLIEN